MPGFEPPFRLGRFHSQTPGPELVLHGFATGEQPSGNFVMRESVFESSLRNQYLRVCTGHILTDHLRLGRWKGRGKKAVTVLNATGIRRGTVGFYLMLRRSDLSLVGPVAACRECPLQGNQINVSLILISKSARKEQRRGGHVRH
jgi:hypothetical protein